MKQFVFVDYNNEDCWLVSADNKHEAISKAVNSGYTETMSDFYYGLEDGQISIYEVVKVVE